MEAQDSSWFTNSSTLFRGGGNGAWLAIAAYGPPIARYLATRYPRLSTQEREDLVHDLLIEMRERLVPGHEPARGRFRQLLQVAIKHRAMDRFRRRRPGEALVEELVAPADDDVEAIELETALIEAISATRDELTQGPRADLAALYALADRIVHGHPDRAIAAASSVNTDRVARLLRKVRERIIWHLLEREIEPALSEEELTVAVGIVRDALRGPRERATILERVSDASVRDRLDTFLARFAVARERFPSLESPAGAEFRRGLELLLS